MKKTQKNNGSIIWRIVVFAVSIYMVVTLCGLWGELISKKNEYNLLAERRARLNAQIEEMSALLNGSEEEVIEKAARERLGYVYSEEQVYIDNSGN